MLAEKYYSKRFNPFYLVSLVVSVIKTGKIVELSSFLYWEVLYKIGYYNSKKVKLRDLTKPIIEGVLYDNNDSQIITKMNNCWRFACFTKDGVMYGNLLNDLNTLYFWSNSSLTKIYSFPNSIMSIYVSKSNAVFICSGGKIYKVDNKKSPKLVATMTSSNSYIRQHNAFTEMPNGTLFFGEYLNKWLGDKWYYAGYLYFSYDDGETWCVSDFLKEKSVNKHIHLIRWSDTFKCLILTDGDNKKKLWVNKSLNFDVINNKRDKGWLDLTKRHVRRGGYTTMAEFEDSILFGSDYLGGTNCIIKTNDLKKSSYHIMPNPYRQSYFREMVKLRNNGEYQLWANVSSNISKSIKSLLMLSLDKGNSWYKVMEYDGTASDVNILNNVDFNESDFLYFTIRNKKEQRHASYKIDLNHISNYI